MMTEVKYSKATLEEYGYKEYKALKVIWKILRIVLVLFAIDRKSTRLNSSHP